MAPAAPHSEVVGIRREFVALNPAYPRSWWIAAYSSDVKIGQVVPVRLLERDVVLWRDSSGTLHCMAAHCSHLGAHLGIGGTVVNDELQCPFHGWRYGTTGELVGVHGPDRVRKGICQPCYRVVERYGGVFLWNGAGKPDIELPDILGDLDLSEDDVVFCKHRTFYPFPAKHLAENVGDGAHVPILHDTGGWAESIIIEQTPTLYGVEQRMHDAPKWWSWENLFRRARKREISNFFAPLTAGFVGYCYGGSLFYIRLDGRNKVFGTTLLSLTPIDEYSCSWMEMMLMPRIRVPLIGPLMQRALDFVLGAFTYTVGRQDAPVMMHRREPANPPYAPSDKATIAFRRLWDGRIDSDQPLEGQSVRHNGRYAGIRLPRSTVEPQPESSDPATAQLSR